jgi:hypothetical protein
MLQTSQRYPTPLDRRISVKRNSRKIDPNLEIQGQIFFIAAYSIYHED